MDTLTGTYGQLDREKVRDLQHRASLALLRGESTVTLPARLVAEIAEHLRRLDEIQAAGYNDEEEINGAIESLQEERDDALRELDNLQDRVKAALGNREAEAMIAGDA